jgi:hypothetical protein
MPFDASRYPNAVTVADLLADEQQLELHCHRCGRFVLVEPQSLPLPGEVALPELEHRFRCTRCGSTETSARPHFERRTWTGNLEHSARA